MVTITTDDVKALREATGISVMQCRKALEEAGGDKAKALVILKKKGAAAAEKKSDRTLGAGIISAYIHAGGTVGVMVELSCETDFVSGNPEFKTLAYDIAMHIAAAKPEYTKAAEITEEMKKTAESVFMKDLQGKPENLKAQIMEGKLKAYFADMILLEQPFIKNPDITVGALITEAIQKFGERIDVSRFARFSMGK